ncbi:endonuclease V [Actinopolymorpha alba]|uniref:endonuclease V n=1 Tax=Actinopolymorpha alba TaxID=533267 RepID=UPI0003754B31|nr:endonuclease V [Actinopolymorpha alba]
MDPEELAAVQREVAALTAEPWRPPTDGPVRIGGCFCCFERGIEGPGSAGDQVWVAAVTVRSSGRRVASTVRHTVAGASYAAGLLALREGPLLEEAVRGLGVVPDVLLVNATGRDHPRRAGLALHLGAVLDLPTVGVTHRPLRAEGPWPPDVAGAASPIRLPGGDQDRDLEENGEVVGAWLRTRAGRRPLVVHAGWRTDPESAVEVVRQATGRARTPIPLREARRLARQARSAATRD